MLLQDQIGVERRFINKKKLFHGRNSFFLIAIELVLDSPNLFQN